MTRHHTYTVTVEWTGNQGPGTADYKAYSRNHLISADGKPSLKGSSDPSFRGDAGRWNPEELLVAALSACHKLWYLHLCSVNGVVVVGYTDRAEGTMVEDQGAGGRFIDVCLRPRVVITPDSPPGTALDLHAQAHRLCFIANSVSFPVRHEADLVFAGSEAAGAGQGEAANEGLEP